MLQSDSIIVTLINNKQKPTILKIDKQTLTCKSCLTPFRGYNYPEILIQQQPQLKEDSSFCPKCKTKLREFLLKGLIC